jgi:hypothetical protein
MTICTYVDYGKHGCRANQLLAGPQREQQTRDPLTGSTSSHSKGMAHHRTSGLTQSLRVPLLCATSVLE